MKMISMLMLLSCLVLTMPGGSGVVVAFTSPNDPIPSTTRIPISSVPSSSSSITKSPSEQYQRLQQQIQRTQRIEQERQDWINRSVNYYSKIMREERRKNLGQIDPSIALSKEYQDEFNLLANKHYFALRKIKSGKYKHAELIYRKIIHDIMNEKENEHCDHAKLAVTTLLLALHLQRMGNLKQTRAVFLHFFRVVVIESPTSEEENEECACSAKVLGAYALFEMKQGLKLKSLEIAKKAIQFDHTLEPVLQWKQFRDVLVKQQTTTSTEFQDN